MVAFYGYCGVEGLLDERFVHGKSLRLLGLNEQYVYPTTATQDVRCQPLLSPESDESILRIAQK
jgi:hypothetical protein